MTRPYHLKLPYRNTRPRHPGTRPIAEWPEANRTIYLAYRRWLAAGGYGATALDTYCVAARFALGYLDKVYWEIDLEADLERVRAHMATCALSDSTRAEYHKGLLKLAQFLRERCHQPAPEPRIHWDRFLGPLPEPLRVAVRAYVVHCRRSWPVERQYDLTGDLLSHLTMPLRWLAAQRTLRDLRDLTPEAWYDYVDTRLAAGISPVTLNGELRALFGLLRFLQEQDEPLCARMLLVELLPEAPHLPRPVPVADLRRLLHELDLDVNSERACVRRQALLDRAWVLLMLFSGLRTGEVRRLRQGDLDLEGRWLRVDESKGLKDRYVCLCDLTIAALRAYLEVRQPNSAGSDHVFVYRHKPLSVTYCGARLDTYGRRCRAHITPHMLRHSCSTMLVNAGAPVTSVQALLGHEHIDTTVGYTQLYDSTVATDYYLAMARVEQQLAARSAPQQGLDALQLMALVDAVAAGRLSKAQRESLQTLRAGLMAITDERAASPGEPGERAEGRKEPGKMRHPTAGAGRKPGAARLARVVNAR